jgi:hypothetical protein
MSKFLLNLLLQIFKALVNSKFHFLIQKFFFLTFGPADLAAHSAFDPASPLASQPPHAVFSFGSHLPSWPPLPRLSVKRALAVNSVPHLLPPELTSAATASRPPNATQLRASGATEPLPPRLHFPSLNSPLNPSPVFNGVKAINASVNPPSHPSSVLPRPL